MRGYKNLNPLQDTVVLVLSSILLPSACQKGLPFTTYIGETHPGFWDQVLRSYTCAGQQQTLEFWCHIPLENQRVVNSTCPDSWENPRNRPPFPRLLEGLVPGNPEPGHTPCTRQTLLVKTPDWQRIDLKPIHQHPEKLVIEILMQYDRCTSFRLQL